MDVIGIFLALTNFGTKPHGEEKWPSVFFYIAFANVTITENIITLQYKSFQGLQPMLFMSMCYRLSPPESAITWDWKKWESVKMLKCRIVSL